MSDEAQVALVIGFLGGGVVGGAVGGVVGHFRGRLPLGIVLGATLGVIGWVILLAMPPGPGAPQASAGEAGNPPATQARVVIPTCKPCGRKGVLGYNQDGSKYYLCPACRMELH
jgi:hypothetical protein